MSVDNNMSSASMTLESVNQLIEKQQCQINDLEKSLTEMKHNLKQLQDAKRLLIQDEKRIKWVDMQQLGVLVDMVQWITTLFNVSLTVTVGHKWISLHKPKIGMMAEGVILRFTKDGVGYSSSGTKPICNLFTISYDELINILKLKLN